MKYLLMIALLLVPSSNVFAWKHKGHTAQPQQTAKQPSLFPKGWGKLKKPHTQRTHTLQASPI